MTELAIALDVGATKIAGCLVDAQGTITEYRTGATQESVSNGSATGIGADHAWGVIAAIVQELRAAAAGHRVIGLGAGSAGPLDLNRGTASPVNIPAWDEFPLVERLATILPDVPIKLAGDGVCAAAGEHWRGGGQGSRDMLAIVVSTGVGGGLVQNGRLIFGPTGNAGHIGHVIIDYDGPRCGCGASGCVESVASGPSMVRWALENGWKPSVASQTAVTLAANARAGDPIAAKAFTRAARALAAGIASVGAVCDLTDAVVGGGVANASDLLFPPLRQALHRYGRLPFLQDLSIRPAELGTQAGLIGAAAMVFQPEAYRPRAAELGAVHQPM